MAVKKAGHAKPLPLKVKKALKIIERNDLDDRVCSLAKIGEYSLAILLQWFIVEARLKLLKFHTSTPCIWPDKLDFINANWTPLKNIKGQNSANYEKAFSSKVDSLRSQRNIFAHDPAQLSREKYDQYSGLVGWLLGALTDQMPAVTDIQARWRKRCPRSS